MAEEENKKRGRGRPQGAKNKIVKNLGILAKNNELSRNESKRLINLFIIKNLQKIEELSDQLSPSARAKLLTDLMKYSTTQANTDAQIQAQKKEKKQINEIKISYEKPQLPPAPVLQISSGDEDESEDITIQVDDDMENIDIQIDDIDEDDFDEPY
ncbi:hypothetical protein CHU00_18445 [Sphingobacterium cellulitidis]|uniref:hypothetical protein n=1 Tax=Sphingobacterium cellulitidis TaxID=1768011 RepID=UPI000B9F072D|nr:hypothetical protein [Sphingobacterium cellulitidis]OYD44147.1 hypothetical protein CHU00_18445 [Sphingobacterium cellulitidis]